ncbi:hypothetical protein DFH07DRAFT_801545 [Mycena maculata]|uniref:Uncharacterized protein n=1 Tax=Mycena maculata TaxID=230809 RepID=A0AAD7JX81_9AGAR|nr:hypothetical protein DFH07DRAFT_801545 [Mycena maculata]
MSTKQETFPFRRPVEDTPPVLGVIQNGRPTPKYALAWVCERHAFYKNLGEGIGYINCWGRVSRNWSTSPITDYGLAPIPFSAPDGNFYLVAMFNKEKANHIERVRDLAGDPLINSARVAMGVDRDPLLEKTLQWVRWPLDDEIRQRREEVRQRREEARQQRKEARQRRRESEDSEEK